MSGVLSAVGRVANVANGVARGINAIASVGGAIDGLDFGATGGVVLGDFAFNGFEVPDRISFGTTQQMTVHKLPGGARVVDLLGPDPRNLDWSGVFLGPDAWFAVQQLDQMTRDGQPLPLTWGNFLYTVLIQSFTADTLYGQARYRISCLVLPTDQMAGAPDLYSAVGDDMNSAVADAPSDVLGSVTAAQTATLATGALNLGTPANAAAVTAIQTAQTDISTETNSAGDTLSGLAGDATSGDLVGSMNGLTSAVAQSGLLAQLRDTAGSLNRAGFNLGIVP